MKNNEQQLPPKKNYDHQERRKEEINGLYEANRFLNKLNFG